MIRETPDYHDETCSHCDMPAGKDVMWINGMVHHKKCVEIIAADWQREEEWKSMTDEEREASYEKLDQKSTFYNGGIPL